MLQFLRSWRDRSRILRDERKMRSQDVSCAKRYVEDQTRAGKRAFDGGDRDAALRIWKEVRAEYPDITAESRAGLSLLMYLQQFDLAEALMQEGCKRHPGNPFFLEGTALVATKRGNNEEAARRYSALRKKFPRVLTGYTEGTVPLIRLGRLDEADQIYGRIAANSTEAFIMMEYAKLAMMRKDWPVALRRWTQLLHRHERATLGVAECYTELGRFDEAEQILTGALKYPRVDAFDCWAEMARIAELRGDWAAAARRWDEVRMLSPSRLTAYSHGALALEKCGRGAEAESILHAAIQRFDSEPQLWIDYARAAERRGDQQEAAARWLEVRVRFPDQAVSD
jgi:predicted Zn-dependent protease